jgi:predicted acyltransferase (DUF342 family)
VAGGAVTIGADATVNGNINAVGAVTVGAGSNVFGNIVAVGAITFAAGAQSGCLFTNAAITIGPALDENILNQSRR